LTASDAAAGDILGTAVAISGDTLLAGAGGDDDAGSQSGSAYIFVRDGNGNWTEQAKLTASDAAAGDRFGDYGLAIDGNTAVIAATGNDDAGSNSGSVYVFTRDASGNWTEQAKLTASDAASGDGFDGSVSIHGDSIVVGTWSDNQFTGSVYTFARDAFGMCQ
jgi:hypothetical protein